MSLNFILRVIAANIIGLFVFGVMSCNDSQLAPVVNAWHQFNASSSTYRVKSGDTIYSIAWAFGLDYRALAETNGLFSPYKIMPGQRLIMAVTPKNKIHRNTQLSRKIIPFSHRVIWQWPVKGRIIEKFTPTVRGGNQGIGIAGYVGKPVRAAASGEIVYSGDGVRGYGNLIIMKHNDHYLSAYAFNQQNKVKVGDFVKKGAVIATMGRDNARRTLLYFEIRQNGKPVNPLQFLQ